MQRPEVVLIDVGRAAADYINDFKSRLFEAFGIVSTRYEQSWEYEQYVRLAEPGLAVVRALCGAQSHTPSVIVAHEFMGLPTTLAAKLHPEWNMKTAYYAHEVPPVRKIVEEHSGHDTMFYNVLAHSQRQDQYINDIFGDQSGYFRHMLAEASRHLDVTLAVGDYVVDELHFLSPEMARSNIRLTYNGIPAYENAGREAADSKARLQEYAQTLLGQRPDYVFTHVTRMTPSKGLWRDLNVMKCIEKDFRRNDSTAVLFVLSTEIGGPRRSEDVVHMERWWDWPVAHREGMPDLSSGEALFYSGVQAFNARSRNCKIVYINQFGFDRASCGERMPQEMQFWDIRKGSDVEFGQSIYEPFGIAQLEALSFGAICVMSSVCGCAKFVSKVAGPGGSPNVIIADYTKYQASPDTIEEYLKMARAAREAYDHEVASDVAREVLKRLPRSKEEKGACVRRGYELASQMSWDVIARDYFLPAVREITTARQTFGAA
jgi:glycosyltransferase involved in cell wall biosynthesis